MSLAIGSTGSGMGLLLCHDLIGVPVGIAIGRVTVPARGDQCAVPVPADDLSAVSWMPIAVMAFCHMGSAAIIFLIFGRRRVAGDVRHRRGAAPVGPCLAEGCDVIWGPRRGTN